jgi:hypothetical protein
MMEMEGGFLGLAISFLKYLPSPEHSVVAHWESCIFYGVGDGVD